MKTMTEFLETNMWAMTDAMIEAAKKKYEKKTTDRLNRLSRQTQYHVVLKPTIEVNEVHTFLTTHTKYAGASKFKAWLVFNYWMWNLPEGKTVQTIVLRGWTKDD
jgi:hypothetical protein